jgi:hypothetical protein
MTLVPYKNFKSPLKIKETVLKKKLFIRQKMSKAQAFDSSPSSYTN